MRTPTTLSHIKIQSSKSSTADWPDPNIQKIKPTISLHISQRQQIQIHFPLAHNTQHHNNHTWSSELVSNGLNCMLFAPPCTHYFNCRKVFHVAAPNGEHQAQPGCDL
jgi:hypothetical protein